MHIRKQSEQGAATLEFALILPILLLIITSMAPLVKAGYEYMVLQRAVSHGVRYASRADVNPRTADTGGLTRRPSIAEVQTFVKDAAKPLSIEGVTVSPVPRAAVPGEQIEITATYTRSYGILADFANAVKSAFFGGAPLVSNTLVTVSARGREE